MIVFTITNDITEQVYIATTAKSPEQRWNQFKKALPLGIKARIYDDMREHGVENFTLAEFGVAMDREHSRELVAEAVEMFDGISLQGVKTKLNTDTPVMPKRVASPGKKKEKDKTSSLENVTAAIAAAAQESNPHIPPSKAAAKPASKKTPAKVSKPKVSTCRASSSSKEKRIKELIAQEKASMQAAKQAKAAAEADEMAAIMARIDSRASSSYRRGR